MKEKYNYLESIAPLFLSYGKVKKGNVICCEISEKESLLILEFITAQNLSQNRLFNYVERVKNDSEYLKGCYIGEQLRVELNEKVGHHGSKTSSGKEFVNELNPKYSVISVGKKYNYRTLYRMRKFYELFNSGKLTTMWSKLTWSHYREILSLKDIDEIKYYLNECESKNLTQRQLHELIKQKSYNSLSIEVKNKLINKEQLKVNDLIPNPIVIKSNMLKENLSEYALKQVILNNIGEFLRQLGIGFTYVGNEYKIKIGDRYNYIDLLLYNIKYKCYVVIELKITELKKEHTGQIMTYMNYIDKNVKTIEENDTIGIIICKQDNEYVIKYCSDERIIAREYELV